MVVMMAAMVPVLSLFRQAVDPGFIRPYGQEDSGLRHVSGIVRVHDGRGTSRSKEINRMTGD